MKRRIVKRELIDQWINEKYPDAISQLAAASRVPASSIAKIRNGRVPKDSGKRQSLARAIGTTENKLFPIVPDGEEQAS